ncbi:TetR/AcrR family transcriptional regulator [Nonlabens ulvanivorans]|uniref:Transcriptional regulator n=1 Tax=Nonlabens ulvanivorans TaxID=906888 RepID=A0A084JUR9_NONUL|nr:TetR/AcrR family transcriptional regulator [Nonlabens ulvanivorans]KEZ92703.1 TetR family transcriptional regulator [Nonlabens ulvanivorans]PRX15547.1 TetR family transcriptional regulator [Nonlabens ulvanivorans]GAL73603.1 transcriptional regulator [Nonlabens ulvanivorans]
MTDIKTEILQKSTEMFLDLGFKSVTMDDISSEMGMSKKTLYSYFKNKEELITEVTLAISNTICGGIDNICSTSTNPIEELYDIKKMVLTSLKGDKSSPIHQLQRYYPRVHQKVTAIQFEYMKECVNKNLEIGIEQGLYRDNLDKDFVSRIYYVGLQGIKDLHLFPNTQFPVQKLHDHYLEYHLRGIVTPAGRKILNLITNTNHD